MIACAFLLFGAFLWLFGKLSTLKFAPKSKFSGKFEGNLVLKYALTLLFTALCLVPFYEGFCVAQLMHSFFDAPSVLCVLLMGFFVFKTFYADFGKKALNLSVKPTSFALLFVYGLLIYLGNLDLIPYDIYTPNALSQPYGEHLPLHLLAQCALIFVLLLALYGVDKLCALLALASIAFFAFGVGQSLLDTLICVYLWAFSLCVVLGQIFALIKGKLCKRH